MEAATQVWHNAMIDKYNSILKNDVREIVSRPTGKSVIDSIWLYKIKHVIYGSISKPKARVVSVGFCHKKGVYYDDTFAPVARYTFIFIIMSLASCLGWSLYKIYYVNKTFFNGVI